MDINPIPGKPTRPPDAPAIRQQAPVVPPANGEGGNRTRDTTIFSRVLYQLSYLAAGA